MKSITKVLDSADHASPKDLLADMLFKAAIVLNNPNKPFGDIGKRIGEIATKGIMEIENDLKVFYSYFFE